MVSPISRLKERFTKGNSENTALKEEIIKLKTNIETLGFLDRFSGRFASTWDSKFVENIYRDRIMYPHEEMKAAKKAVERNAYLQAASRTRGNFITGGHIGVNSDDKATQEYFDKRIKQTGLNLMTEFIGGDSVVVGNFYAERIIENGQIITYQYINTPERMFHVTDNAELITGFFLEIPEVNSPEKTTFTTIPYYGDRRKSVKGKAISKDSIFFIRFGQSQLPTYGRGLVCTVTNDFEILLEVERSIAVISRYKAIPKKLIQIMQTDGGTAKMAEWLGNMLSNLEDYENPISPYELKVDDLSYSGKEPNWTPIVDYLKKKLTISLAPSFMMHGEETNYAVSRDQKAGFMIEIESNRKSIGHQIKKELLYMARLEGFRPKEFDVVFGDYDLGQNDEHKQNVIQLFNGGLITRNEARDLLDLPTDDEAGNYYIDEIRAQSQMFGNFGSIPNESLPEIANENIKYDELKKKRV